MGIIENDVEREVTVNAIDMFKRALALTPTTDIDPRLDALTRAAMRAQLIELEADLAAYDALAKRG